MERQFSRRAAIGAIAAGAIACGPWNRLRAANSGEPASADLDFPHAIRPTPTSSRFGVEGHWVWGGSLTRTDEGTYHLLFSYWPKAPGFEAWVTHSIVGHATAPTPLGPFTFQGPALQGSGDDHWDADVIHNPTVLRVGKKFYLYYMGTRGTGEFAGPVDRDKPVSVDARWWNFRNNQRVGVAVADHPAGPWKRFDEPLIQVSADSWDRLIAANPSVTARPGGGFLMVYKTVAPGKMPFGGKVLHAVATSDSPTGPFKRFADPVFTHPTAQFPAEDPFIWYGGDRYFAVVKDNAGYFTRAGYSLALFESKEGTHWQPAPHTLVTGPQIQWEGGRVEKVRRMERPQLYLESGRPAVLRVACQPTAKDQLTFNVGLPLKWPE